MFIITNIYSRIRSVPNTISIDYSLSVIMLAHCKSNREKQSLAQTSHYKIDSPTDTGTKKISVRGENCLLELWELLLFPSLSFSDRGREWERKRAIPFVAFTLGAVYSGLFSSLGPFLPVVPVSRIPPRLKLVLFEPIPPPLNRRLSLCAWGENRPNLNPN